MARKHFRTPSRKQLDLCRVARVNPVRNGWDVEFTDDMSIHVHRGQGRSDQWFAMRPVDLRHDRRSPGPETRKAMQYAAITAVTSDRPVEFFIDSQDDVVAIDKGGASSMREGDEGLEITIPTMGWKQVGGDMDPGAHGGTIARGDGHYVELINIQPVRAYVGDNEAKDVGFPFWTRVASFDADDLTLDKNDVQSAMRSSGLDRDALEELTPEQRALAIADALLNYGRAEEGPAGWSADIGIPDQVEWWGNKVAGAEYLADEDDAFRNEVLGEEEEEEDDLNESTAAGGDLSNVKILFRAPDTLTLYGIPYEMRPGQQPGDLWRAGNTKGWIWLGSPGWYGNMSARDRAAVEAFLADHMDSVPGGPYEWDRIAGQGGGERSSTMSESRGGDGFRVAHLGAGARRVLSNQTFSLDEAIRQLSRLKRQGRTAWVEDVAGNFVPVHGAMKRPRFNAEHGGVTHRPFLKPVPHSRRSRMTRTRRR